MADATGKRAQTQAAISQIRQRGAVLPPTIDFTVHVADDGQTFSTTERVVKEVQAPAFFKPTDEQFYSDETRTKPDIAFLKNHFYREGRLTDEQVSSFSPRPSRSSAGLAKAKGSVSLSGVTHLASSLIVSAADCPPLLARPSSSCKRDPSFCARSPTCSKSMLPSLVSPSRVRA